MTVRYKGTLKGCTEARWFTTCEGFGFTKIMDSGEEVYRPGDLAEVLIVEENGETVFEKTTWLQRLERGLIDNPVAAVAIFISLQATKLRGYVDGYVVRVGKVSQKAVETFSQHNISPVDVFGESDVIEGRPGKSALESPAHTLKWVLPECFQEVRHIPVILVEEYINTCMGWLELSLSRKDGIIKIERRR